MGVGEYVEGGEREKEREEQASSVLSKPLDCVPIGLLRTRARASFLTQLLPPHEKSVLAG